jgi:hypothetical protein
MGGWKNNFGKYLSAKLGKRPRRALDMCFYLVEASLKATATRGSRFAEPNIGILPSEALAKRVWYTKYASY